MADASLLDRLFDVIEDRRLTRPEGSYVVSLLEGGHPAIAAKVSEECEEAIEAAASGDVDHLAREVADLIFHTFVMMSASGLAPAAVYGVLQDRFGIGGLEEKAARHPAGAGMTDGSGGEAG